MKDKINGNFRICIFANGVNGCSRPKFIKSEPPSGAIKSQFSGEIYCSRDIMKGQECDGAVIASNLQEAEEMLRKL